MSQSNKRWDFAIGHGDVTMAMALAKETDRGCVLVAVEFLSEAIDALLRDEFAGRTIDQKLQDKLLTGVIAPLGTFAMRTTFAYVFGLIPKPTYDALETIRKIRNTCAHRRGLIDLKDNDVKVHIEALERFLCDVSKKPSYSEDEPVFGEMWENAGAAKEHLTRERLIFMDSAHLLFAWLFSQVFESRKARGELA